MRKNKKEDKTFALSTYLGKWNGLYWFLLDNYKIVNGIELREQIMGD